MTEHRHAKTFVLNFMVGAGFFITSLFVTTLIGSMLGLQLRGTLSDLGTAVGTWNPALAFSVVLSFLITGFLVWLWAKSRMVIGTKLLGMERLGVEPKVETRKKLGLLATIIVLGIITSVIMVAFNGFIASISPTVDLSNPTTLVTALAQYNIVLLISVIITVMFLGTIVTLLGHWIEPIQHRLQKSTP